MEKDQKEIPAFEWGQSRNMAGSLKILATTDAAITHATSSHLSLEDCLSSIKSLMPLTNTHSVLESNKCNPEKKNYCIINIITFLNKKSS